MSPNTFSIILTEKVRVKKFQSCNQNQEVTNPFAKKGNFATFYCECFCSLEKIFFFYQECPISVIILAALRKVPGSRASCKALRWHKGSLRGRREGKGGFGHEVIRFAETTSTHILPYSPFIWPNIHKPKKTYFIGVK